MVEHRLIERLIAVLNKVLAKGQSGIPPAFVDAVLNFVRTYVDRIHHGKEEDILFRALAGKQLSSHDQGLMDELAKEHAYARGVTARLAEANEKYRRGDAAALTAVVGELRALLELYPQHIAKEDKDFFPAYAGCLSADEERTMADDFCEFDRKVMHEQYERICRDLDRQWGGN
jgi:hemerythrin-like domain-containing protein